MPRVSTSATATIRQRDMPGGDGMPQLTGAQLRATKPTSWLSDWKLPAGHDALGVLERAAVGRDKKLVKRRNKEMSHDAPTFLRGAAGVMAADLTASREATTGIRAGDLRRRPGDSACTARRSAIARLRHHRLRRGPSGPWEWDICGLAPSVVVTALDREVRPRRARSAARRRCAAYCVALSELAESGPWSTAVRARAPQGAHGRADLAPPMDDASSAASSREPNACSRTPTTRSRARRQGVARPACSST